MGRDDWHRNLDMAAEDAERFLALAEGMNLSPQEILKKMIAHVLEVDREMNDRTPQGFGLGPLD